MRVRPFAFPEIPPAECQLCGGSRLPLNHPCTHVASYESAGNNWRAVLRERDTRKVVAVILGSFPNRDQGSKYRPAAKAAAGRLLAAMQAGDAVPRDYWR